VGRYVESDPILQPTRNLIPGKLVFAVPGLLRHPGWLQPYAYVASQPITRSDEKGLFWPWDAIKCWWYSKAYYEAVAQCKENCGPTSMDEIKFMEAYKAGFLSDAIFKCACQKIGGEACLNALESCGNIAIGAPTVPSTQMP
jgi:hypothetical protein